MSQVILALDVASADQAERMLDRLPALEWVKIGSVLMTREGGTLARRLAARGLNVFLDLKWHDIPNTVAGAVTQARDMGVAMATVHTLGGPRMLAAAQAAAGDAVRLVGVTVLTSHDAGSYGASVGRVDVDLEREVERLASTAAEAGLAGVVCSPAETSAMRTLLGPNRWVVVPGIRRAGDRAGDQQRVATPAAATRAGASHLVVGRPILEDPDPARALAEIMEEARCAGS